MFVCPAVLEQLKRMNVRTEHQNVHLLRHKSAGGSVLINIFTMEIVDDEEKMVTT